MARPVSFSAGDAVKLSQGYWDTRNADPLVQEALAALTGVVKRVYRSGVIEVVWGQGTERSEMPADLELVE
jgi:hypothetical protein